MKKIEIDWQKIEAFLKLTNVEKEKRTGVPAETWSRIKSGTRSLTSTRIRQIAPEIGFHEIELYAALVFLREEDSSSQAA